MTISQEEVGVPCRIEGLTSEKGKNLNGWIGRASYNAICDETQDRIPVVLDGYSANAPLSIKRSNLLVLSQNFYSIGMTIQRKSIRNDSQTLTCCAVDMDSERMVAHVVAQHISRSRAIVQLLDDAFQKWAAQPKSLLPNSGGSKSADKHVLISCTDLPVTLALSRVAFGGDASLEWSQYDDGKEDAATWKRITKNIRKLHQQNNFQFFFIFYWHLGQPIMMPDAPYTTSPRGPERVGAVCAGLYKIYPCPHQKHQDAIEVRYSSPDHREPNWRLRKELFLGYGETEGTNHYVRHVVALGREFAMSLLEPKTLAAVDPQAFWAAVLHLDVFVKTLKEQLGEDSMQLVQQWQPLVKGCKQSKEWWSESITYSKSLSPEVQGEQWGLGNETKHKVLAPKYTILALLMVYDNMTCIDKDRDTRMDEIYIYEGTEIERFSDAHMRAIELTRAFHRETRIPVDQQIRDQFLNQALEEHGFGSDALDLTSDPLASCQFCGDNDMTKLKECANCGGSVYCSKECQRKGWKKHKKHCSPILAEAARMYRQEEANFELGEEYVEPPRMYEPREGLPMEEGIFSEVSGVGSTNVFWNPMGTSLIMISTHDPARALTSINELETEAQLNGRSGRCDTRQPFDDVWELSKLELFLLACGPLSHLEIAQLCISEALELVGGDITRVRIPGARFTALEWAAKKGNERIVNWLLSDPRTVPLISVGSPMGWALYTGRVAIARKLMAAGASADATDDVFWKNMPPMFAAAQNGKKESIMFLVEDCAQNLAATDAKGMGVLKHIKNSPHWRDVDNISECHRWAKQELAKKTKKGKKQR